MKITNAGPAAHTLSFRGQDHLLGPGNFIETDLTKEEAKAIPAPFVASGEPVKAAPEPVVKADKKGE